PPFVELDDLDAEHITIERIRPFPVGHPDHEVIEAERNLYSHSMVAGGFDVTSSTTRFTPGISLTMRPEIVSIRSYGRRAQSAVMASSLVTARITAGYPYVRSSPCTPTERIAGSTTNDCHSSR